MYSNANMHIHSNFSDGALSPGQIVHLGAKSGLRLLSITDHNTIGAYGELLAADSLPLEIIIGAELTCRHFFRGLGREAVLHICAYFPYKMGESLGVAFGSIKKPLGKICSAAAEGVSERRAMQVRMLRKAGFDVSMEEALGEAARRCGGREGAGVDIIDIAAVLAEKNGMQYDFALQMLKFPNEFYVAPSSGWFCFGAAELMEEIARLGGFACLAHPTKKIPLAALDETIGELAALGLNAVEAYNRTTPEEEKEILRLAEKHCLLVTKGNDFHDLGKPINPDSARAVAVAAKAQLRQ